MSSGIQPAELGVFVSLGTCGSLSGVARGGDSGPGEMVKVRGNLTTNDGEIAVNWRSTAMAS